MYLIDTENVRSVWTLLLDNMTAQDKIYVFFTMNSGNVSYENLNGILSSGKQVELMECFTGKNGLDFQLVSYLGYLIKGCETAEYIIISDDGGYDAAIRFWEKKGCKVSRKTAAEVTGKPVKGGKKASSGKGRGLLGKSTKTAASKAGETGKAGAGSKAGETSKTASASKAGETAPGKKSDSEKKVVRRTVTTGTKKGTDSAAEEVPAKPVPAKAVEKPAAEAPIVIKFDPNAVSDAPVRKSEPKAKTPAKPAEEKREAVQSDAPKAEAPGPALMPSRDKLLALLPEEEEAHISQIYDLLVKAGSPENLADIHDGIEKIYRDERGTEVYRILRPKMKDIYKA
ncbi:MAG: hypothetical protein K5891_03735 [Lachnospiraceae bacterium]|nr:hypothetical protein [Lachnospiraceae bacterium]